MKAPPYSTDGTISARRDLYQSVLELALRHSLSHIQGLEDDAVAASVSKEELRRRLDRPLADQGLHAARVIDDLVADVRGGILGNAGGRFFAWVMGGALPSALAADWLTSTWDQNATLHASGPAVAIVEEICGTWLKELLGLPHSASFAVTTGTQLAHMTCLAAARNALLKRRDWDVETKGLFGAPHLRVLTTEQQHGSVDRALRFLGLGSNCVERLRAGSNGRMDRAVLKKALAGTPEELTIVVLQAGDINTAACDAFTEITPMAHEHGAWVHVDGAFALWANASPRFRGLLDGVERADSWTADGHKWLNVPFDCGYAFVADTQAHRRSMTQQASYLVIDGAARDALDWTPEWSRRARSLASYAAIRELGRDGIANQIERCCDHAASLVRGIGALDGAQVLWEPILNQGLVSFAPKRRDATQAEKDKMTDNVVQAVQDSGEAFFGGVQWRGQRCMRVSVCNWQTTDADVRRAIRAIRSALSLARAT